MLDYRAKFVLAPMVRIGELPTRLVALKYGADLVWGPEIIDKKLLTCERKYNEKLRTVDFLSKKGNKSIPGMTDVVFRTYPEMEKDKVVFQMGTANPELAVEAAKIVINDVGAIDINAGCPKHFSIHAGMGAALLSTPDLLCNILTSLVTEVGRPNDKPISVKIRLLPTKEDTLKLVTRLVNTGIANLTLHCRTREMRNREPPIRDYIDEIKQICVEHKVSFIINGSVQDYSEYKTLQEKYGDDVGAMIASAAEINPTCFHKEGTLPWYTAAKDLVKFADQFMNHPANTKYCIQRIIPNEKNSNPIYKLMMKAKTIEEISKVVLDQMDNEGKLVEDENKAEENTESEERKSQLKRKVEEPAPESASEKKIKV
jgi:tRNA-dihydrouridine synthase 2